MVGCALPPSGSCGRPVVHVEVLEVQFVTPDAPLVNGTQVGWGDMDPASGTNPPRSVGSPIGNGPADPLPPDLPGPRSTAEHALPPHAGGNNLTPPVLIQGSSNAGQRRDGGSNHHSRLATAESAAADSSGQPGSSARGPRHAAARGCQRSAQ